MAEPTGRLTSAIRPAVQRIVFGEVADALLDADAEWLTRIDMAHIVMLVQRGIVAPQTAARILEMIDELRATEYAALRRRRAPRGLFLLYEQYLIDRLGPEAGVLHTARSRNDLGATAFRLRLRGPLAQLIREALRLMAVLIRRADRFADCVMPAYTHYQAAAPITYGHYLAALAHALSRDIASLLTAGSDLGRCPLGAGAVAGTTLPIDQDLTAALLGFDCRALNSVDAVASRDLVLHVLGAAVVVGTTLSRLATDFLLWTSAEFGFLVLPDDLVGSSSALPQKRNPFLLEHVQARASAALGAFTAAAGAMHATPYTNSIAVGTESIRPLWGALRDITDALMLTRPMVADGVPQKDAMLTRATESYIGAAELAHRLVRRGVPFRSAHRTVADLVRTAIGNGGEPLERIAAIAADDVMPDRIAERAEYGGGPGPVAMQRSLASLRAEWRGHARVLEGWRRRWQAGAIALDEARIAVASRAH